MVPRSVLDAVFSGTVVSSTSRVQPCIPLDGSESLHIPSHTFKRIEKYGTGEQIRSRRLFDRDAGGRCRTDNGAISADGRTLYLGERENASSQVTRIVGVDLATGEERLITTFTAGVGTSPDVGIAMSPYGGTLAVAAWMKANETARIFTIGVDGSNYHDVVASYGTGWLPNHMRWTPDGRTLLFVAFDDEHDWRIMRVSADGGTPEFDGPDHKVFAPLIPGLRMFPGNFNSIELSPDGSRIAISMWTMGKHELWALDGLMSVVDAH